MGVQVVIIAIYLSFMLDFLVWPIPSEASTFAMVNLRNHSKIFYKAFLIVVFVLNLIFYLTPLGLSIIYFVNGTEIHIIPIIILGLFLTITGRIITITAALRLRKNDKGIVSDSVYKYSLNPISLGMHFTIMGFIVIFGKWYLWLGFAFYLVNMHLKIKVEETFLQNRYGVNYTKYKNATPRYLIKI